jgi:hypothetical protein
MIDLKALPHTETLVPITITRLGEERSTRYQISQSEAKPESQEQQELLPVANKYTRGKYGHLVNQ